MDTVAVSFERPPVVEVVAAVAFAQKGPAVAPLMAAFWADELRDSFPILQSQPPYQVRTERFPVTSSQTSFNLELGTGVPYPRLWALNSGQDELLQLQAGWFACNWRKVAPNAAYDRWDSRRAAFERWYGALSRYMEGKEAGTLLATQCEVTYINHISANAVWSDHGQIGQLLAVAAGRRSALELPLEQVTAQAQFRLERNGSPWGRLHVQLLPAFGPDAESPLYVLELTARGAPLASGQDGVLQTLDAGRDAVNAAFVSLITPELRKEWGQHHVDI